MENMREADFFRDAKFNRMMRDDFSDTWRSVRRLRRMLAVSIGLNIALIGLLYAIARGGAR